MLFGQGWIADHTSIDSAEKGSAWDSYRSKRKSIAETTRLLDAGESLAYAELVDAMEVLLRRERHWVRHDDENSFNGS